MACHSFSSSTLAAPTWNCYHCPMRWRIAIAVLIVIGIAGAVYVGTEPRKGTVEWHKRGYLGQFHSPIRQWIVEHTPDRMSQAIETSRYRRMEHHWAALVRLDFIRETLVVVSNSPASVISKVIPEKVKPCDDLRFFSYELGTNSISLWCTEERIGAWQDLIRQADVPETK